MLAAGTGGDVNDLARLDDQDLMPDATTHNNCIARSKFNAPRGFVVFEHHRDTPRDEKEDLVSIWMHLTTGGA